MLWASGGALDQYARIWISLSLFLCCARAGELVYSNYHISKILLDRELSYPSLLFSIFYILYILSPPTRKKGLSSNSIFFLSRFYIDVKRCQTCTSARTNVNIFSFPPIFFTCHFLSFFFHCGCWKCRRSGAAQESTITLLK